MIDMHVIQDIREMRRDGSTIAEISRKTKVSEPTVRKYVKMRDFSPKVPEKKDVGTILDDLRPVIDGWLEEDRRNWHKQRHTAKRIWERIRDEHGFTGSYSTVQRYVKAYKQGRKDVRDEYLDQDWPPGAMQVDFGQADMRIVGVRTRTHNLVCDFPFSNVGLAQVFFGETAECVCEGLASVFEFVGGVPICIVFDNATGVGRKICGEIRTSRLFSSFAAHYGFSYRFCNPNSGHEKGGVENMVGALRRSLFVPIPQFDNVRSYNERLLAQCMRYCDKPHYRKGEGQLALFEEDCFAFMPLPESRFNAVSYGRLTADKYGNVVVDGRHRYSSDPSLGGCKVIVGQGAFEVAIYDSDGTLVATHPRSFGDKPTESIDPVSTLSLLCRKPNGWHESRVRASLPDDLREWLDRAEAPDRNRALRILRDVNERSGWSPAVEALQSITSSGGSVDLATATVLASGIANGRGVVTYDEPVDMAAYDDAFALVGGACDAAE